MEQNKRFEEQIQQLQQQIQASQQQLAARTAQLNLHRHGVNNRIVTTAATSVTIKCTAEPRTSTRPRDFQHHEVNRCVSTVGNQAISSVTVGTQSTFIQHRSGYQRETATLIGRCC